MTKTTMKDLVISGNEPIEALAMKTIKRVKKQQVNFQRTTPDEMKKNIESCVPLAVKMAKSFSRKWPHLYDEFYGAAHAALVEASMTYNPAVGTKFITWCHRAIWLAVMREYQSAKKCGMGGSLKSGSPDLEMLSLHMGYKSNSGHVSSLMELVQKNASDSNNFENIEIINALRNKAMELNFWFKADDDALDMWILNKCYSQTLKVLGEQIGLSKERIRQRITQVQDKLRLAASQLELD